MLNFYPFIGKEVEFPKPVYPRLVKAFNSPKFISKKRINFRNVDPNIPIFRGKEMALALGGGIDSPASTISLSVRTPCSVD